MTVVLVDKKEKELGKIHITILDIATGPAHQDFILKLKTNNKSGRINFDVKMS